MNIRRTTQGHPIKSNREWRENAQQLHDALRTLLDHYIALADSGAAGYWNPDDEVEVQKAKAALALEVK